MTTKIDIRDAEPDDVHLIADMTRAMLEDMALHGGNAPAGSSDVWENVARGAAENLGQDGLKYLIAETPTGDSVGLAYARSVTLDPVFEPRKAVHISIVYVLPEWRGCGVGSKLVSELLNWAVAIGGEFCSLNVLAGNPAQSLYARHGFRDFEVNMRKPL